MVLTRKNIVSVSSEQCFAFKSNLNIKNLGQNLNVYFNKKTISYCIIFETNIFKEMVICGAARCKNDSRQGKA